MDKNFQTIIVTLDGVERSLGPLQGEATRHPVGAEGLDEDPLLAQMLQLRLQDVNIIWSLHNIKKQGQCKDHNYHPFFDELLVGYLIEMQVRCQIKM